MKTITLTIALLFIGLSLFAQDDGAKADPFSREGNQDDGAKADPFSRDGKSAFEEVSYVRDMYRVRIIEGLNYDDAVKARYELSEEVIGDFCLSQADTILDLNIPERFSYYSENSYDAGAIMERDKYTKITHCEEIKIYLNPNDDLLELHLNFLKQNIYKEEGKDAYKEIDLHIAKIDAININKPILLTRKEEVRTVNDGVPYLRNIPLIGGLFRTKGESRMRRDIVLIIEKIEN